MRAQTQCPAVTGPRVRNATRPRALDDPGSRTHACHGRWGTRAFLRARAAREEAKKARLPTPSRRGLALT